MLGVQKGYTTIQRDPSILPPIRVRLDCFEACYWTSNTLNVECLHAPVTSNPVPSNRRPGRPHRTLFIHVAHTARTRWLAKRINCNVARGSRSMNLSLHARICANRITTTLEVHIVVVIESVPAAFLPTAHIICDRRGLTEPTRRRNVPVFVNEHNHPHTNRTRRAEQRCAVDPTGSAFFVGLFEVGYGAREPADFRSHTARAVGEGVAH